MVKQSTRPTGTHRPLWELHPDDAANASSRAGVSLNQSARIRHYPRSLKNLIVVQQETFIVYAMNYTLPLENMSLADKLQAMEDIWTDLSNQDSGYTPPQWHDEILKERQKRIDSGDISFTDWEVAKKEIRKRIS
jgi:hypothetical protein